MPPLRSLRPGRLLSLSLALLVCAAPDVPAGGVAAAAATTLEGLDTPQLVRLAPVIAVARVGQVHTEKRPSGLHRRVSLSVAEPVRGASAGQTLDVLLPGGDDGVWAERVEGVPELVPGAWVLVFLSPAGGGAFHLVGLEQGVLDVFLDPAHPAGGTLRRRIRTPRLALDAGRWVTAPMPDPVEPLRPYLDRLRTLSGSTPPTQRGGR